MLSPEKFGGMVMGKSEATAMLLIMMTRMKNQNVRNKNNYIQYVQIRISGEQYAQMCPCIII